MNWSVETASAAVEAELTALPADVRVRLSVLTDMVESSGPAALPPKATKNLESKLWELRIMGRDGIARVIYLTLHPRRMVLLCAFVKKSQKTPLKQLELARQRAKGLA
jgi:phage-related protein